MPRVDLETLMWAFDGGSSECKIACDSLSDDADDGGKQPLPNLPPDSFWLAEDAEFDWFDRNAFYERKESVKANSGSILSNPGANPAANLPSHRVSNKVTSKTSIIGLPKTQKTNYNIDSANRKNCKPVNVRLFPKRSASMEKSAVPMTEPSSPNVSCIGRVKSKRKNWKWSEHAGKATEKDGIGKGRCTGTCKQFISLFLSDLCSKSVTTTEEPEPIKSKTRKSVPVRANKFSSEPDATPEPPGLGGMKQFASSRRSS